MKKIFTLISMMAVAQIINGQGIICNQNGNLVIVTNYDGGPLNIVVDVNIPNLVFGLTSYEALQVNFSGPFVNNISGIIYAGANSNNNHCNLVISTTTIQGVPATVPVTINISPTAPVQNPNGNATIICGHSCDTTSSQGGCNTVDEIEDYFLLQFPGSSIYSHHVQYGCYTAPMLVSEGGTCCASPPVPLTISSVVSQISCAGLCDGNIAVTPQGNAPPYSFFWSNSATTDSIGALCAGTYTVTVTDSNGITASSSFVLASPAPLMTAFSVSPDAGNCSGLVFAIPSGGTPPFTYLWDSCGTLAGNTTVSLSGVCAGTCCLTVTDSNGCIDSACVAIPSTMGIGSPILPEVNIFPNPSSDGIVIIEGVIIEKEIPIEVIDATGRFVLRSARKVNNGMELTLPSTPGLYILNMAGLRFRILVCPE